MKVGASNLILCICSCPIVHVCVAVWLNNGTLVPYLIMVIQIAGAFAGFGFFAWYLSGKVQVFDRRGHIGKLCLVLFPLLLAAVVGVSRVDDYRHHWQDVFAGGLLGWCLQWINIQWLFKNYYCKINT